VKDLGSLMKQAQAMQQKLADAQAKIAELTVEGSSGGGMVKVVLKGTGDLARVELDESLMQPGEEFVAAVGPNDLVAQVLHGPQRNRF